MAKRLITYNGETHSIAEWARRVGIPASAMRHRFDHSGWTVEEALTKPPVGRNDPRPRRSYRGDSEIEKIIAANPGITTAALAQAMNMTRAAVSVQTTKLVACGRAFYFLTGRRVGLYYATAALRDAAHAEHAKTLLTPEQKIERRREQERKRYHASRGRQPERQQDNDAPKPRRKRKAGRPVTILKGSQPWTPPVKKAPMPVVIPAHVKVQKLAGFTGDRWGIDPKQPVPGGFLEQFRRKCERANSERHSAVENETETA